MTQTTREEGDPTYDPLDQSGMCGVLLVVYIVAITAIFLAVLYAHYAKP